MLYEVWTQSKTWHVLPSELLFIKDEVAAYYVNRSVMYFGIAYDNDIEEHTRNAKDHKSAIAKARLVQKRWLQPDDVSGVKVAQAEARAQGKSGFRDPAELLKPKE